MWYTYDKTVPEFMRIIEAGNWKQVFPYTKQEEEEEEDEAAIIEQIGSEAEHRVLKEEKFYEIGARFGHSHGKSQTPCIGDRGLNCQASV